MSNEQTSDGAVPVQVGLLVRSTQTGLGPALLQLQSAARLWILYLQCGQGRRTQFAAGGAQGGVQQQVIHFQTCRTQQQQAFQCHGQG